MNVALLLSRPSISKKKSLIKIIVQGVSKLRSKTLKLNSLFLNKKKNVFTFQVCPKMLSFLSVCMLVSFTKKSDHSKLNIDILMIISVQV